MPVRYSRPEQWIADCRRLVRQDLDNLILFTGPEGMGKSTVAFQIMRQLDPEGFGPDRVHLSINDFLEGARATPRYGSVQGDEILANRRKAMHGGTIQLLDFLQECRGLNLHMGICFPHESLFEGAILDYRVRYKVHVPGPEEMGQPTGTRPGVWILYERRQRKWRDRLGQERVASTWVERGRWRFVENRGPLWAAYREKKETHMRQRSGVAEPEQSRASGGSGPEWEGDVRAILRGAYRVKYPNGPSEAGEIRGLP